MYIYYVLWMTAIKKQVHVPQQTETRTNMWMKKYSKNAYPLFKIEKCLYEVFVIIYRKPYIYVYVYI